MGAGYADAGASREGSKPADADLHAAGDGFSCYRFLGADVPIGAHRSCLLIFQTAPARRSPTPCSPGSAPAGRCACTLPRRPGCSSTSARRCRPRPGSPPSIRPGSSTPAPGQVARLGLITQVVVAGRGGVPAGATTAVLNVTVISAAASGFVTVFPCRRGAARGLEPQLRRRRHDPQRGRRQARCGWRRVRVHVGAGRVARRRQRLRHLSPSRTRTTSARPPVRLTCR